MLLTTRAGPAFQSLLGEEEIYYLLAAKNRFTFHLFEKRLNFVTLMPVRFLRLSEEVWLWAWEWGRACQLRHVAEILRPLASRHPSYWWMIRESSVLAVDSPRSPRPRFPRRPSRNLS